MKAIIYGSNGKMGKMVKQALLQKGYEIAAEVSFDNELNLSAGQYNNLEQVSEKGDVLIDFSNHASTKEVTAYIRNHHIPAVIGTTGQSEEEKALIREAARYAPVFYTPNLSLGIAVLNDLVKRAAALFPDADIEIVEIHHNQKLDVPSGTALQLAESIKEVRESAVFNIGRHENRKRAKNEVGIHSLRMGNEVGTHEIFINTGNECITLRHDAKSRAVFADGAVKAAEFIIAKTSGIYTMKELLNS